MNTLSFLAQTTYSTHSGGAGTQTTPQQDAAFFVVFLVIMLIAFVIGIAIAIVVNLLLQAPLKAIPEEHRAIEPGQVWLLLIPIFNLFWSFKVFQAIPDSFKSFFDSIGRRDVGDCGRSLGLWYAICLVCSIVPCVNYIAGPASLVLLIIFLVKMHGYKDQVRAALGTA
jgi:hypothetical protein